MCLCACICACTVVHACCVHASMCVCVFVSVCEPFFLLFFLNRKEGSLVCCLALPLKSKFTCVHSIWSTCGIIGGLRPAPRY